MTTKPLDDVEMRARVGEVLNRWPSAGLAVGVVRPGSPAWFRGHGLADVASGRPVDEDTVFRVGSITKTVTAIALMQLWEEGMVDLDAPADSYLRSFPLVAARVGFGPVTLRHLLTHTSGLRCVRGPADLLRPDLGWGSRADRPVPTLAAYYGRGLRVDIEPGTRWAYCNHGYAVLGQVVEDVSGVPVDRYLRERVFEPLGMRSTDLVRSRRVGDRLATGYALRRRGLAPVADREVVVAGAGALYSTTSDLARYAAALLDEGANEHGSVLRPGTLAEMFAPHHQPDPRLPGMGLGFFRNDLGGHRTVGHDGIWKGFLASMVVAPDDGVGVIALTNTGGFDGRGAAAPAAGGLLRHLLGVAADGVRTDVPERPDNWGDLCGWYSFGPGLLVDPLPRLTLGAGLEVVVRRGHLVIRGQVPVRAVRRGLRLHPDGDDPDAFRVDLGGLGLETSRVVFGRGLDGDVTTLSLGLVPMTFHKRPPALNPRPWMDGAVVAGAAAAALRRRSRRGGRSRRKR